MNRLSIALRTIALLSCLSAAGCLAQASPDVDTGDEETAEGAHLVGVGEGDNAGDRRTLEQRRLYFRGTNSHPASTQAGPFPEPWQRMGPFPEPWDPDDKSGESSGSGGSDPNNPNPKP